MSTPRQTVADQILADNPTFRVVSYPWEPDNVPAGVTIVSVFRATINPHTDDENRLRHELGIQLYVSPTQGDKAEDQADDAIDAVLLSLQRIDGLTWTEAARRNFGETGSIVGYKIDAEVHSENVYKNTVTTTG